MWISKKKYDELINRIDELINRINVIEERTSKFIPYGPEWLDQCRGDINDIQRIMENSKLGEITYKSIFNKTAFLLPYEEYDKFKDSKNYTLIYKDFKEYKIVGLYLNKPQFEIDEKDNNLIHVKDNVKNLDNTIKVKEYIVDLQNQTFIRTK